MSTALLNILVFKTDLRGTAARQQAQTLLDTQPDILRWSIDEEDIDCVLRIEGRDLGPDTIVGLLRDAGFACTELPD